MTDIALAFNKKNKAFEYLIDARDKLKVAGMPDCNAEGLGELGKKIEALE